MFGFGKEKIGYNQVGLLHIGNISNFKDLSKAAWHATNPSRDYWFINEHIIEILFSNFGMAFITTASTIPSDQKAEIERFIPMYLYFAKYIHPDPERRMHIKDRFSSFKEFIQENDRIKYMLENDHKEYNNSHETTLYTLLEILNVNKSDREQIFIKMNEVKVELGTEEGELNLIEWFQQIYTYTESHFKKLKIRVDAIDQEIFHKLTDEGSFVDYIK